MNNSYLNQLFKLATEAHQGKKYGMAQNVYRQILRDFPDHPDALHLMGLSFSEEGKLENAIRYISKALQQVPENPVFLCNLGEVYRRGGEAQKAYEHFTQALKLKPDFAEAKFNLGNLLQQSGQIEQAIQLYQQVLQQNPTHAKASFRLGCAFLENGQFKSALETLQKTVALAPNYAEAHNNLGIAHLEWDQTDQALLHYEKALALNPGLESAKQNLAALYERLGQLEKSRAILKTKQNYILGKWDALLYEKALSPIIESSNEAIKAYRETFLSYLQSVDPQRIKAENAGQWTELELPTLSHLLYQGQDEITIKKAYAALFEGALPVFTAPNTSGKPHIGFVVTSGHEGVFLKCMRGILNQISDKFRVTVICNKPNGEKIIRPAITNNAVQFLSIPSSPLAAAKAIHQTAFDLLLYWEIGTDKLNYLLPFMRLAKVQCGTWGWPGTSGIPNVDYFISTHSLEPQEAELHYSEKLWKQNKLPVYYYRPPVPATLKPRADFGLQENHHYYLCQQNLRKVQPDFDALVKGILTQDPEGYMLFIHDKHASVTHLLEERLRKTCGEVFARILFLPRMEETQYLNVLALADVALDTLHYGGGANTCYDAFATGTPLITLPGRFHRGRYALAAYEQMGYTECVAHTPEAYITKAVTLGKNKIKRQEVSEAIKKHSRILFEDQEAVKELESTFEQLISKHN